MSSRRRVSAGVARRRALAIDLACGALLAVGALTIAAGVGVVGVGALTALLLILAWMGIESAFARARRRSASSASRPR